MGEVTLEIGARGNRGAVGLDVIRPSGIITRVYRHADAGERGREAVKIIIVGGRVIRGREFQFGIGPFFFSSHADFVLVRTLVLFSDLVRPIHVQHFRISVGIAGCNARCRSRGGARHGARFNGRSADHIVVCD